MMWRRHRGGTSALVGVAELDADSRPGRAGLGDCMVPGALAGTAHHEKVTAIGSIGDGTPAPFWTQLEGTSDAERDDGHDGLGQLTRHPIPVPGDTVRAVAIQVRADLRELHCVTVAERLGHVAEDGKRWF